MNGVIALFKERGMTSFDCISALRKILHTKKIGHTGTLDPDVDGVLPICVGEATKISEIVMNSGKTYQGSITLGLATDTEDITGNIIETLPITKPFSDADINAILLKLTGEIQQIPPMYSAVKINGRKLYEYAREGIEVKRSPRTIKIDSFTQIRPTEYDAEKQQQTIYFEVSCSKGTYVRTLASDFGKLIGVPAVMSRLTRIKSGGFTINETNTLSEVQAAMNEERLTEVLKPLNEALSAFPAMILDEDRYQRVKNGGFITPLESMSTNNKIVRIIYHDELLALYQFDRSKQLYRPYKMFIHNN